MVIVIVNVVVAATAVVASLAWSGAASAADPLSFPSSADDYPHWYVTAYYDHSGKDYECGSMQYSGHKGSDFGAGSWGGMNDGRDITAAAAGEVTYVLDGIDDECSSGSCGGGGGYGNHVRVTHPDGSLTVYAHMKTWSLTVAVGDQVSCGDKLGEMGSSGNSTGPHLHFEIRPNGSSSEDPFSGTCASSTSLWASQGPYGGLPDRTCSGNNNGNNGNGAGDVTGLTYLLDLGATTTTVIEPAGSIGGTLQALMPDDQGVLFGARSVQGGNIEMVFGAGMVANPDDPPGQWQWIQTNHPTVTSTGSWADPVFDVGPLSMTIEIDGTGVWIGDATLAGEYTADATEVIDAEVSMLVDTVPLVDVLGWDPCDVVQCVACPSSAPHSGAVCARITAEVGSSPEIEGLSMTTH
jgi:hypothetical protein